jgi:hypothetical protein
MFLKEFNFQIKYHSNIPLLLFYFFVYEDSFHVVTAQVYGFFFMIFKEEPIAKQQYILY